MPVWQDVGDGVELRSGSLPEVLADLPAPVWALSERGDLVEDASLSGGSFVMGDQDGFSGEQLDLLEDRCEGMVSVGPVALQADQVVSVVHNGLDRG